MILALPARRDLLSELVAHDDDKIVKVRVNVSGFGDREARSADVTLAKRTVRQLRRS